MDFDFIAPWYRFFEHLAFGRRLQKHRLFFLSAAQSARHALVLGDGDGRFLEQLALRHPLLSVDALDLSPVMTNLARQRLSGVPSVHFITGDARTEPLPKSSYDFIATHFFLDCFTNGELNDLIGRLARHAAADARWVVSEFQRPDALLPGWHAALWLKAMYFFFRLTAGLATRTLPNYRPLLTAYGFVLAAEHSSRTQLICSELWHRGAKIS